MMIQKRLLLTMLLFVAASAYAQPAEDPLASFTRGWRDDKVWYDGKCECAVYDATRTIYGKSRSYEARLYTNKEMADPVTKTKSSSKEGREAFKQHLREDVPTENYTYHFSTMVYVGTSDLKSLKVEMGSQEDCGTTFKQLVNHKGTVTWLQWSYFPDEGMKQGTYAAPAGMAFADALSVVLRGYPFDQPREIKLPLLESQTSTHLSASEPATAVIQYVGKQTLKLPVGDTAAHHVRVTGASTQDYWFAADPAMRHVLVQYEGPGGVTMRLKQVERRAYWER